MQYGLWGAWGVQVAHTVEGKKTTHRNASPSHTQTTNSVKIQFVYLYTLAPVVLIYNLRFHHSLVDFEMDSIPRSNPPSGNLQPNLHAAVIVTPILAITAVVLRFFARRLVHVSIWLDDWLTLVALVRCSPIQKSPSR